MKPLSFLLILMVMALQRADAAVIYVDSAATGNNDGSSWANAYSTLTAALAEANAGQGIDSILIATGIYYPPGMQLSVERASTFSILRGGIKLFGGFPNGGGERDITTNTVFLDGDIGTAAETDNSYHVMVIAGIAADADSIIVDGLSIRSGYAGSLQYDAYDTINGQAIRREYGGGLMIHNVENGCKTSIRNCIFDNNTVRSATLPPPSQLFFVLGLGAGIYINNASPSIYNCTVLNNKGTGKGIGIYLNNSAAIISKCIFQGNTSSYGYPAVYCKSHTNARFISSIFTDNAASTSSDPAIFSEIQNSNSPAIINCLISKNHGNGIEGDIDRIINCTIAENKYGFYNYESHTFIENTIFYRNRTADIHSDNNISISHSIIANGYPGSGNISTGPMFNDTTAGDFHLLPTSPAINSGNNSSVQAAGIVTDIEGNDRIVGNTVDMGAYEYPEAIITPPPATDIASVVENDKIIVYPNPATSTLHINSSEPLDAIIYGSEGRLLLHCENARDIDLKSLIPGIYQLRLYDKQGKTLKCGYFTKQ